MLVVVFRLLHDVRRLGDAGARVDGAEARGTVAVLALLLGHLGLVGVVVAAAARRTGCRRALAG